MYAILNVEGRRKKRTRVYTQNLTQGKQKYQATTMKVGFGANVQKFIMIKLSDSRERK